MFVRLHARRNNGEEFENPVAEGGKKKKGKNKPDDDVEKGKKRKNGNTEGKKQGKNENSGED